MLRLILIALSLVLISCKKEDDDVPQSLIDFYSAYCDQHCKPQLRLLQLDNDAYYGIDWSPTCSYPTAKLFFYKDGRDVEIDKYEQLLHNGQYKEVIWQCQN
jgi:hypothetical protein